MKKYFFLILLLLLCSCNKENSLNYTENVADTYYKKAKAIGSDSAFYYFNLAKISFLEISDSVGVGKSLVNMAIIQHDNGDYYGGIETSLEANKFLTNTQDSITKLVLASSYNNMGICSSYLYEFENSVKFYKEALKYTNNIENKYTYYNNLGNVLTTIKKYPEAKKNLNQALDTKNKINYARALNNLARAKFNEDSTYNALPELYEALEIRRKGGNLYEENSSYATLSNYFFKKNPKQALYYAKKMLDVSTKNNSKEDQVQALQKIIILDKENYSNYFLKFQTLNDSLQIAKSKAKNQFAVVRYDVEQKNAQNQILKAKSFKQNAGIASLAIILVSGYFWNEKRKKSIRHEKEKEKQLEVKNTELKYSKKVHDVVANGLYHLMIDIDNNPDINKVKILNDMEKMYEESRDISHDKSTEIDFHERFGKMINSYSTAEQKVILTKYAENIWENIPQNTQSELFYVVREFLVNMKKHSEAKMIVLKFEKDNNILYITYTDNGKGIKNLATQRGSGIRNTENRIDTIGGDIIFEENPNGGLIIKITIPIHSKYV